MASIPSNPVTPPASGTLAIDRAWIAAEFTKLIDTERSLWADAKSKAEAPPDPTLSVLYHEIATADERHVAVLETIATRYGHTPSRSVGGGVGETLGRLKDKMAAMGSSPLDRMSGDLAAKANAVHWQTCWVHTFGALGDPDSARDLAAVLLEDQAHRDALQQGLNRLLEQCAREGSGAKK